MAGLEARVTWRYHGVARRATGDAACFSYARTRNRTMACDTFPLRSPIFARVSRTSEVALARAIRETCGNVTKSVGSIFLLEVRYIRIFASNSTRQGPYIHRLDPLELLRQLSHSCVQIMTHTTLLMSRRRIDQNPCCFAAQGPKMTFETIP